MASPPIPHSDGEKKELQKMPITEWAWGASSISSILVTPEPEKP